MTIKPITGFKINGETQPVSYPHLHGKTAVEFTEQTLTDEQKAQARTNIDVPSLGTLTSVETNLNGSISANKKQIENLKKLAQGKIYDFETDTTSAYVKNVPTGAAPYAALKSIGGKSIVMNQPIPPLSETVISYSRAENVLLEDGVYSFTPTAVHGLSYIRNCYVFDNVGAGEWPSRKYYVRVELKNSNIGCWALNINTGSEWVTTPALTDGGWHRYSVVVDCSGTQNLPTMLRVGQCASALETYSEIQWKNLSLIDLTLAGLEDKTAEELDAMFPDYIPYTEGEIVSAEVQNVKARNSVIYETPEIAVGDVEVKESIYIPFNICAACSSNATFSSGVWRIELTKKDGTHVYAGDGGYPHVFGRVLEASTDNPFVLIAYRSTSILSGSVKVSLIRSDTPVEYKPYREENFPIPEAVKNLEGYGWSAGTAKNWVDFEKKVYHREVTKTVLGVDVFGFSGYGVGNNFRIDIKYVVGKEGKFNERATNGIADKVMFSYDGTLALSESYSGADAVHTYNNYIFYTSAGNGSNLKSVAEINEYLKANPVTVYYELETPEEIDISDILTDDNLIEVEQGGTLTFENIHGDSFRLPVPSEVEYMINLQEATA